MPDTKGVELAGIKAAGEEATMALADAVEDAWAGHMPSELSVEVVDEEREPQFCATIRFEPGALRRQGHGGADTDGIGP